MAGLERREEILTNPEHIIHKSPSAWANLDQVHAPCGTALGHPLGDEPNTHELSEDLGNLGRRNKITFQSELVSAVLKSAGIVASEVRSQAHSHIAGQRHWSGNLVVM
jgi:hypothetical protein